MIALDFQKQSASHSHRFIVEKAKFIKSHVDAIRRKGIQNRMQRTAEKMELYHERKEKEQHERLANGLIRDALIELKVRRVRETQTEQQQALVSQMISKEMSALILKEIKKEFSLDDDKEASKIEWANKKYESSKNRLLKEQIIQVAIRVDFEKKSLKREKRFANIYRDLPRRIALKKLNEKRLLGVARKYWNIWINKIKLRKAQRAKFMDEDHKSLWIVEGGEDPVRKVLRVVQEMEPLLKSVVVSLMKSVRHRLKSIKAEESKSVEEVKNFFGYDSEEEDLEEEEYAVEFSTSETSETIYTDD